MFASRDDLHLTEVSAGVWQLRLPIPWEEGHVNCFLLPDGGEVDLIDCGMNSEESLTLIWAAVERLAGPGARLRRLLVTHIHPDHYGGAGEITQRAGAELYPQSTPNPLDDYLEGLRRIEDLRPSLVLPSHGQPFSAVSERVAYLVDHHRRRKEQMLSVLEGGEMNGWQVAIAVWGLRPNLHEMRMALQEGLAHLQSLSREGRIEKRASSAAIRWRRPT
jgi:glyoxylase-like metal-dependent hydrolase (beta-lactamase superfamily II)